MKTIEIAAEKHDLLSICLNVNAGEEDLCYAKLLILSKETMQEINTIVGKCLAGSCKAGLGETVFHIKHVGGDS